MISYLGDFAEDAIVYIMFNTFSSDDPSASCTITNFINTDVHIHKDDGLAQRNNAAGITVSVDFDGITGSHMVKIDTSDDTVAGFWVVGHEYFVRIEGTTIDGATINSVVGQFSIENRFNEVPPTVGEIRTEMEGVGTKLTNVLGDTDELQTNQGNWLTATGFSIPNEYDTVIAALQTDLDNPSQYMANISTLALEATLTDIKGTGFVKDTHSLPQCLTATGFSVPNEYDIVIAALQTDLDNPTQYKADVSTLATAIALATAQSDLDTITGADGVTLATLQALYAPNKVVPDVVGTAAGLHTTTDGKVDAIQTDATLIKAKTDSLPSGIAKNVALPKFDFLMVLSSDDKTGATGKTVTGKISKDCGSFATITNSITEVSDGMYAVLSGLTQAEMNCDVFTLIFSASGCNDRVITIHTT